MPTQPKFHLLVRVVRTAPLRHPSTDRLNWYWKAALNAHPPTDVGGAFPAAYLSGMAAYPHRERSTTRARVWRARLQLGICRTRRKHQAGPPRAGVVQLCPVALNLATLGEVV